jgi:hypothetical protein
MANPCCVKCGGHSFQLTSTANKISGANYAHFFVNCSSCGGVAGIVEPRNVTISLEKIMKKLGISLT